MTDAPHVLWLDDAPESAGPLLGGKFSSLAELTRAGFSVPPGFGITTRAFDAFYATDGLIDRVQEALAGASAEELRSIERASADVAGLIDAAPLPPEVEQEIREGYAGLERRTGIDCVPVAVRSSGVLEDTSGASFAGQYDTFLWVCGAEELLAHVRRCWAGLFGAAVLTYRPHEDPAPGSAHPTMCVGVQQMVDARAAGVMFTLDPVTGDRSKVVIEAVWGLGEGVVSGDVTPDRFRVDKVTLEALSREVNEQPDEHRFDAATAEVRRMPIPAERGRLACLDDERITALATEAKRIERHRGAPQDIEWAVDDAGAIHILQVRPETVWSRRPSERLSDGPTSGIQRVLANMVAPTLKR